MWYEGILFPGDFCLTGNGNGISCKKGGFESPSYFGSVFRKHQGMTPDAYRKWIPVEH